MPANDVVLAFRHIMANVAEFVLDHLATAGAENVAEYMAEYDDLVVKHQLPDDHPHELLTIALDRFDEPYYAIYESLDMQVELHIGAMPA